MICISNMHHTVVYYLAKVVCSYYVEDSVLRYYKTEKTYYHIPLRDRKGIVPCINTLLQTHLILNLHGPYRCCICH